VASIFLLKDFILSEFIDKIYLSVKVPILQYDERLHQERHQWNVITGRFNLPTDGVGLGLNTCLSLERNL